MFDGALSLLHYRTDINHRKGQGKAEYGCVCVSSRVQIPFSCGVISCTLNELGLYSHLSSGVVLLKEKKCNLLIVTFIHNTVL